MTVLAFIRHGSTDWNIEGRMQGQQNVPLNEEGRKQAYLLGQRLAAESWDFIVSSDLLRASETAEIINSYLSKQILYDQRLRELSFGQIEGTTKEERQSKWGANWREKNLGIEGREAAAERGTDCIKEIMGRFPDKKIIVVTHGTLLKEMLQRFELTGVEVNAQCLLQNTSVTVLKRTNESWETLVYGCVEHLK
jgi:probable phosphoglycerate mutase